MGNDLKILVTATLNTGKSIGEINTAIGGIEKKIRALKLNVEINDKVLNTLNNFTKQMSKISDVAKNTGKVIQESINPDGSRTKLTFYDGLKGEFSKVVTEAKKAGESQTASLKQVEQGFDKATKASERYNASQQKIGGTHTLSNNDETIKRTISTDGNNNVLGYKDTFDYSKADKQTQQLETETEKLTQDLMKLGETGNVTAQQLNRVGMAINGVKDTTGLQQAKQELAQLSENAKLAEQMAQGRERGAIATAQAEQKLATTQTQTAGRNIELTRQEIQQGKELEAEIKRRLELYQREKQLQATNLRTRYGGQISQSAMNEKLSPIASAKPSDFKSLEELRNWTQQSNTGIKELTAGIQNANHHALSFGESLKTAFSSFGIWLISGTALMQSLNFFKDGISFANELNQALTEVSIVTGQNQEQVNKLGESYNKLAQSMGVTTVELSKTASSLFRQGLSEDEVTKRMKTITEYAKISSLDVQTATEIMTASINSMGVSAKRASDVFSYLGDATASGADEIGKSMQKVGGTAGALDIPFEKVSSWAAEISSRTRESAETIGQSIKGILARVQALKEGGFDESDGTKVSAVAKALNAVGVQLMDNQGQFRNFGKVMDDLGNVWGKLDSRQKAYIATTVAGTYQQSR